ncbi:sigma-70 family RNA polymerase sigma factor [Kribbella sp. NPDC023855]|uniref:RNA polymerase sigma factor n=1 Tax=Kribbella sp. NPDC023855 TaxID=3154698 RepID=UPI0033E34F60
MEEAHRACWSTVLASTVRLTRDLDLAEDCTQDAFVQALRTWPEGVPSNPAGWLTTVARRLALDRLRRETTLRRKLPLLVEEAVPPNDREQPTDPLRLVFTCCHPALARESQIALTLRLICGLTTREVAAGLLISEATAAARITRAKKKIAAASIPYRIPADHELAERLDVVLTVVQLVYTAGHVAAGPELTRTDLTGRALELAHLLVRLMPEEPEPEALLALLQMTQARGDARLSEDGELVLLADQDRTRWNAKLLAEGVSRATAALQRSTALTATPAKPLHPTPVPPSPTPPASAPTEPLHPTPVPPSPTPPATARVEPLHPTAVPPSPTPPGSLRVEPPHPTTVPPSPTTPGSGGVEPLHRTGVPRSPATPGSGGVEPLDHTAVRSPATPGGGRFVLQAAIAGLHVTAPSWEKTDWQQVVRMYDAMLLSWPSPIVALNRAAAHSFVPGADLAAVLDELDALSKEPALKTYAYLPATRADVLTRLNRPEEAIKAYDEAITLTANDTERRSLQRRRSALL